MITLKGIQNVLHSALGWLIDPFEKRLHVYQPGQQIEIINHPTTLSADPVLPGFELDLARIW